MSTLSQTQILFILRALGLESDFKVFEESQRTSFFNKPFIEAFQYIFKSDIYKNIANVFAQIALKYQVDYDSTGKLVLRNPPQNLDAIRLDIEVIGMRIPNKYRASPELAMTYIERFGQDYLHFNYVMKPHNPEIADCKRTIYDSYQTVLTKCAYFGMDPYLNRRLLGPISQRININAPVTGSYLTWFTDFDIFKYYPFLNQYTNNITNRLDMANILTQVYRPAGIFEVTLDVGKTERMGNPPYHEIYTPVPSSAKFIITHTYNGQTRIYVNQEIQNLVHDGKIWFDGQPISYIGLYQIAFLLKPSYYQYLYEGFHLGPQQYFTKYQEERKNIFLNLGAELYHYLLNQIKIEESSGVQKIRFSEIFKDFNEDLNASTSNLAIENLLTGISNITL